MGFLGKLFAPNRGELVTKNALKVTEKAGSVFDMFKEVTSSYVKENVTVWDEQNDQQMKLLGYIAGLASACQKEVCRKDSDAEAVTEVVFRGAVSWVLGSIPGSRLWLEKKKKDIEQFDFGDRSIAYYLNESKPFLEAYSKGIGDLLSFVSHQNIKTLQTCFVEYFSCGRA